MEELRRSTENPVIAGVAAGLGNYFNTSPLLFRILFILTALWGITGLLIYIVLWIGLPTDQEPATPEQSPAAQPSKPGSSRYSTLMTGVLLIVLGLLFLLEEFIPAFYFEKFWPVLLVILGLVMLYNSTQQSRSTTPAPSDSASQGQSSSDSSA
jgi:phage shock protein C